jgi:hypothetical protein
MTVTFRMHPAFQALLDSLNAGALVGKLISLDRWKDEPLTTSNRIETGEYFGHALSHDGKSMFAIEDDEYNVVQLDLDGKLIKRIAYDPSVCDYMHTIYPVENGHILLVFRWFVRLIDGNGKFLCAFDFKNTFTLVNLDHGRFWDIESGDMFFIKDSRFLKSNEKRLAIHHSKCTPVCANGLVYVLFGSQIDIYTRDIAFVKSIPINTDLGFLCRLAVTKAGYIIIHNQYDDKNQSTFTIYDQHKEVNKFSLPGEVIVRNMLVLQDDTLVVQTYNKNSLFFV